MKNIIFVFIVFMLFVSCEKEDLVTLEYRVSNAFAVTEITYKTEGEPLIVESVDFQSGEDVWSFKSDFDRGGIVYLSSIYQDSTSSVTLQILIDGKVYKERSSINEPGKYLIVSGSIPY